MLRMCESHIGSIEHGEYEQYCTIIQYKCKCPYVVLRMCESESHIGSVPLIASHCQVPMTLKISMHC